MAAPIVKKDTWKSMGSAPRIATMSSLSNQNDDDEEEEKKQEMYNGG